MRKALCRVTLVWFCSAVTAQDLRIEHVTIVSPERSAPMRDASVTIRDGRILAIGRSPAAANLAEVIDGTGLYLTPGLIDSHIHSDLPGIEDPQAKTFPEIARALRAQLPRSYLYFGYTTLINLIATPERLAEWNTQPVRPDLYFCGAAEIPGGYPSIQNVTSQNRGALLSYMIVQSGQEGRAPAGVDPLTHTPEAVVARMKHDGASCVKTFYERGFGEIDVQPAPRLDTIRYLVKAAHAAHMPVLIHANSTDGQEFAVAAGADISAHGLWHWNREQGATELTPRALEILDGVLKAKMGWQPTMQVLYGLQDLFNPAFLSDPEMAHAVPASVIAWYRSPDGQWYHDIMAGSFLSKQELESHDAQLQWNAVRRLLAAPIARDRNATHYMAVHGGRILFGTDTPSAPSYANPPGLNGWLEMQRMAEAGMTPLQVLRAATADNAEALGLGSEIGTVQTGKRANLLLLREDPAKNVRAFDEIVKVIVRGKVFDRAELAADGDHR